MTELKSAGLASRKFLLAVLVIVSASVLVYLSKIDAGVYSVVVVATIGGYLTANVAQKKVAA